MTRTIMMSKKKEPTYNTNVLIHLRNTDDIIRRKNNHHLKLSLGFFRLSQSGLYWMFKKKCKIQYVLRAFNTYTSLRKCHGNKISQIIVN